MSVDHKFHEHVKSLIGDAHFDRLRELNVWQLGLNQFRDTIKRNFDANSPDDHVITFPKAGLPDVPSRGLKRNTLTLTRYVATFTGSACVISTRHV